MTAASEAERRRLGERFAALCRVYSPSRAERLCADLVRTELAELGIAVAEDDAAQALGGDCGNLLARIPGRDERSVLFCAHLDTVPSSAPIEPVLRDGGWENANPAILGADNKAAVAALLALAERLVAEPAQVGIELLFTVGEEIGLLGAKEFETGLLRSDVGFTFDAAMPIGGIVVSSPTYYRLTAELRGLAAHAGVAPENGRSAASPRWSSDGSTTGPPRTSARSRGAARQTSCRTAAWLSAKPAASMPTERRRWRAR